jgi:nuclear pore complex protein Nup54
MFYNQVNAPAEEVRRANATKPPQIDQLIWDQAQRNNPDPSRYVPVQACGFDDLKKRIEEQNKLAGMQVQTLHDATKLIEHLRHKHTTATMARLEDYKAKELDITQRLVRIISKLVVLEARGTRLTPGEERLKRKFEKILQDLSSPVLYRAKIDDIIAISRIAAPPTPLPQVDERSLENIAKVLKEQRSGLEVLTTMLQKDLKDTQFIYNELSANQQ